MSDEFFSFKDEEQIKNLATNLESQNILQDPDLPKENRVLMKQTIKILHLIEKLSPYDYEYLNENSKYIREEVGAQHRLSILFNEFSNPIANNALHADNLRSFLLLMAYLSVEITYNYYATPNKIVSLMGGPIRKVIVEMEAYVKSYIIKYPSASTEETDPADQIQAQENDLKTHVEYFSKIIQQSNLNKVYESAKAIKEETKNLADSSAVFFKKTEDIVNNAEKMIPKMIGDALEENATKLSESFDDLLQEKKEGKRITFGGLGITGLLLIAVPCIAYNYWWGFSFTDPIRYMIILLGLKITFSVTIEILLIYFFRIMLHNYYKIKTEIMQLEIRKALSSFLPIYALFSKDKETAPSLEHFSNFIFKPLVPNAEDIPKVSDGIVEAITNLLNRTNKGS